MSDLLFMKQFTATLWLGLRLPYGIQVTYDGSGVASVSSGWCYDTNTAWPEGVTQVWVPRLDLAGVPAPLAWDEVPIDPTGRTATQPFQRFEAQALADTEEGRTLLRTLMSDDGSDAERVERFNEQLGTLRTAASVPLRAVKAYRDLEPADLAKRVTDVEPLPVKLLDDIRLALGGPPKAWSIDLFSGLLFLAEARDLVGNASLIIDKLPPTVARSKLSLVALQSADRVTLRLSDPTGALRNDTILSRIGGGDAYSPFYRMRRSQGVEGRSPMDTGKIVIPRTAPTLRDGPDGSRAVVPDHADGPWKQRPFQIVDRLGGSLVGELLRYDVTLYNMHGRRIDDASLLLVRKNLAQPAPPTRGVARLRVNPNDRNAVDLVTLELLMDFGPEEAEELDLAPQGQLRLVVYGLASTRVPTGFYGDADDAALAVGRLLSDLDPAAVLASGAASSRAVEGLAELAELRLSAQGLKEIPLGDGLHVRRRDRVLAKQDVDNEAWSLVLPGNDIANQVNGNQGLRLFAALRRTVDAPLVGKREIESTTIALDMSIVDANDGRILNTVQHFEDFWTPRGELPTAELWHARVFEPSRDKATTRPKGIVGSLRIEIDHVALAGSRHDIGGYRLWMREAAGSGAPWQPLAIVQVLPPLVKAYAPIETGRFWIIGSASEAVDTAQKEAPTFTDLHAKRLFRVDGTTPLGAPAKASVSQIKLHEPGAPLDAFIKTLGEDGTALLAFVKQLADAGFAAEHILSVAQRRQMERARIGMLQADGSAVPAPLADDLPAGNWLVFEDQNGHVLGRAWSLWGDLVKTLKLRRRTVLVEVPNLQDTVGSDDFGKASWTWHGITDPWGHDFEWIVEPLDRYAPLLQRIHAPTPPSALGDGTPPTRPPNLNDRYRHESALIDQLRPPPDARVHKYRVQRTAPLAGEGERAYAFGVVQRFVDDRFIFRVFAPDEFRLATGNSVARSAYGVLGLRICRAERRFALDHYYEGADALLPGWMATSEVVHESPGETSLVYAAKSPGAMDPPRDLAFCELVVDEPDCLLLDLEVQPFADAMAGVPFVITGAARRAPGFGRPGIDPKARLPDNQTLTLGLPLLEWSYVGDSQPPLSLLGLAPVNLARMPLLRLPDPMASIYVQLRGEHVGEPYELIAAFLGPVADGGKFDDLVKRPDSECVWGSLYLKPDTFQEEKSGLLMADPANLQLSLRATARAERWRVTYRRGSASMLVDVK